VLQCVARYPIRCNLNSALYSTSSAVCCSVGVLQGVEVSVCCSMLQCVAAVCCSVLQCVARYPIKCNLNRALHSKSSADEGKQTICNRQLATKFATCKFAMYNISKELTFENSLSISYTSDPSRRNSRWASDSRCRAGLGRNISKVSVLSNLLCLNLPCNFTIELICENVLNLLYNMATQLISENFHLCM